MGIINDHCDAQKVQAFLEYLRIIAKTFRKHSKGLKNRQHFASISIFILLLIK